MTQQQLLTMKYKETRSLFLRKYQYKVVLISPLAALLRNGVDSAIKEIEDYSLSQIRSKYWWANRLKTGTNIESSKGLFKDIKKLVDYELRIEPPNINFYTNNLKDVKFFERKYPEDIKYISKPSEDGLLAEGTIVMPKMNYDFKITMGSTKQEYTTFIEWAEKTNKVKLTKSCIRDLSRSRSWGGTHFYVNGDNTLLMVKMHLGSTISKVQRIVKQNQD